jgi:hypothetical protein
MVIIAAVLWCLLGALICYLRGAELPYGMHLCTEIRVDTLLCFTRTPASRVLNSLIRADSVAAMRRYDSLMRLQDRPRQRLNAADSAFLEWK